MLRRLICSQNSSSITWSRRKIHLLLLFRPFEKICKSLIRKADNEAYQTYELVESLKNVVFDPLTNKLKEFANRVESINDKFEDHWEIMINAKHNMLDADSAYSLQSKSFSDAVSKIEFNSKDRTVDFLDEKLFISLNTKMKLTDIKSKDLLETTDKLNHLIAEYKVSMKQQLADLEAMEADRVQAMVDALNQMNIFQTNCDMNNKYDANNFYEAVENISPQSSIIEFGKVWEEADFYSIDTYAFQPYDELISKDDYYLNLVDEAKENEWKIIIKEIINKWRSKSFTLDNINKDEIAEMMNDKVWRYWYTSVLLKLENYQLPNEASYEGMAYLINALLKGWNRNDDSDYLRNIISVCSKFYYDVMDGDDAVIRTPLTEAIRGNTIWDNYPIWWKAIFKDFRDIIKKFKIPDDHNCDLNKDEILRNVLFNRMYYYVSNLAYFDMNGHLLFIICNRFSQVYKFTSEQREKFSK